ncbi:glycosyltransferase family 4 protein [Sorangium sp. So ce1335]|uniref:glycosyltransferase family 4 protein n=1 Tax=Sorangium sp. So ce1335 TaxID=3133335 RepID=UPI003F622543
MDNANGLLRVLLVAMEYTPKVSGGVGTYVFELANGLARAGCAVTVLAYTPGEAAVLHQPNLEVHLIAPRKETFNSASGASLVQGILTFNDDLVRYAKQHLGAWRPDIVHFHQWHTRDAGRRIAEELGVPVVGTSHHLSEPTERWWGQAPDPEIVEQEKRFYDGSTHVITVSESMRSLICETYGLPAHKIDMIHCALNLDPFFTPAYPESTFAELRRTVAEPDEAVVLYTGRIHPQKGIPAIFAAAERVLAERSRVVYLLAGGTDSRESTRMIQELSARYASLGSRIKVLGKLPRKQLRFLHRIADMALVPSLYEPFGFTAIEAMASGVPVIAARSGGLAEIVQDGESGLLVPVRQTASDVREVDVERLAAAQLTLLADPALARRLGREGQRRVAELFQLPRMIQGNLQVFWQLLGRGAAPLSRGRAATA